MVIVRSIAIAQGVVRPGPKRERFLIKIDEMQIGDIAISQTFSLLQRKAQQFLFGHVVSLGSQL